VVGRQLVQPLEHQRGVQVHDQLHRLRFHALTPRIRLLIPYYGTWPAIFPLFLDSCRRNPNLDVRLFTDNSLPAAAPPNVTRVAMSYAALWALISRQLGLTIGPAVRPYKLCDFRPAFGVIFEEYLRDAEFWAHGDVDLVYGNTAAFLSDRRLDTHDVLTFRHDWMHGPLTVYRNTPEINRLFEEAPGYRDHFQAATYRNFDECLARHELLERGVDLLTLEPRPTCMTGLVRAAARDGRLRLHAEMAIVERLPGGRVLTYRDGQLTDDRGKPVLMYHLFREKKLQRFAYPPWSTLPPHFHIAETGFYSARAFRWYAVLKPLRYLRSAPRYARRFAILLPGRLRRLVTRVPKAAGN
jgi:hypothetical protein